MLVSILLGLTGLLGAFLLLQAAKDLIWYLKIQKYTKQGIASRYVPVIGYAGYLFTPGNENGLTNFIKMFTNESRPEEPEPLVVTNGVGTQPCLLLNNKTLVKEFFKQGRRQRLRRE